jgi:hypothetical protein
MRDAKPIGTSSLNITQQCGLRYTCVALLQSEACTLQAHVSASHGEASGTWTVDKKERSDSVANVAASATLS